MEMFAMPAEGIAEIAQELESVNVLKR